MYRHTPLQKKVAAAALVLSSIPLFFVKTSRDFVDLTPTDSVEDTITLASNTHYEQTFFADRATITRISLFLRPVSKQLPNAALKIRIIRENGSVHEASIPSVFIDAEGASQAQFNPLIQTDRNERLRLVIDVPQELNASLRLMQRPPDGTFDPATVAFRINNELQEKPAAYQVYYHYRPPLALQLAGLMLVAAWQLFKPSLITYSAATAFLFGLPALLLGHLPLLIMVYAFVAMVSMAVLLQKSGLPRLPALVGAHVFAFTTYFPLHAAGHRSSYVILAALPASILLVQRGTGSTHKKTIILALILAITGFIMAAAQNTAPTLGAGHVRDIFLDPNQVPASQTEIEQWDHYGSYIGIISMGLAAIGSIKHGMRFKTIAAIGALGALASLAPPVTNILTLLLPFPPQHLVLLLTFAFAFFAGLGFETMRRYFGKDRIVLISTAIIAYIALLDLWHVAAATLEFPLL